MKVSRTLGFFLLLLFGSQIFAQDDLYFITNSKPIDDNRYEDIKSTPYYFNDWVIANLIDKSGNAISGITINYNGYSDNIEVKKGDNYIELDTKEYKSIEVLASENKKQLEPNDGEKIVFKGNMHNRFKNRIVQVIYEGENIAFINDFDIVLSSKEVQNVGKAIEFKQFVKRNTYYLLRDGELKVVKLNRRKILEVLGGDQNVLVKYIKKERINLTSHDGLAKLMAYYDSL